MNRQIVWPGAIPLETDLLNTNRNAMVSIGRLAMDLLGTTTAVSGLACTQTTVASMAVNIGAGAIYSLQNVDNTAYSSLPADTADQIVKQGILLASANTQITMAAPTTAGYSVIYLIEAAFSEVDGGATILPYYNSSNPSVPYSGPGGAGTAQYTTRQDLCLVQAKAGIAATTGTQVAPTVDAGFVPLYYVTVAYGQTAITSTSIAIAPGAPFLPGGLANFMPIAGGTFTGTVSGPTASSSDNSTKLATTAFVQTAISTLAALALGAAQTWQNVTASRASGTNYTNGTGKPIQVMVVFPDTTSLSPTITVVVGGLTLINSILYDQGSATGCAIPTFIVPPGATYSVTWTSATGVQWNELR